MCRYIQWASVHIRYRKVLVMILIKRNTSLPIAKYFSYPMFPQREQLGMVTTDTKPLYLCLFRASLCKTPHQWYSIIHDLRFPRRRCDAVWLVKTDVPEERVASIIKVKRISELGTMLAVTSNWSTLLATWRHIPEDGTLLYSFMFQWRLRVRRNKATPLALRWSRMTLSRPTAIKFPRFVRRCTIQSGRIQTLYQYLFA
jgi:hypothetical protein